MRVVSTRSIVLPTSALKPARCYSETRSRSKVSGAYDIERQKCNKTHFSVANLGFIRLILLGLADSDIYDPKRHLKCPRNFQLPPQQQQPAIHNHKSGMNIILGSFSLNRVSWLQWYHYQCIMQTTASILG